MDIAFSRFKLERCEYDAIYVYDADGCKLIIPQDQIDDFIKSLQCLKKDKEQCT